MRGVTMARCRSGTTPAPLPVLPDEVVLGLLPRTFTGQWGHKEPGPEWAVSPGGVWLGLRSGGEWIGLCRVEAERRAVDGSGFVPAARTGDGVRRLVLAAGARLGPGPVIVETWGEDPDPYLAAGFELTEVVAFHLGRCHGTLMYKAVEWFFPQHGQTFSPVSYENVCAGTFHGTH